MNRSFLDIRELLRACVDGDPVARRQFQEEYGEDIYNFPVKLCGLPLGEAGDFYVYAFGEERLFARLRTFEGRNGIQFRTFLSYYVLKHLFLEWRRTRKELETISLHAPLAGEGDDKRILEDVLSDETEEGAEEYDTSTEEDSADIWRSLSPEERLDIKLLSLLECDLEPDEVRLLARISGRPIVDTLAIIAEVREGLKRKDEKLTRLRDELDSVWGWIMLRQKALQENREKLRHMMIQADIAGQAELCSQQKEIERALAKRYRQRERLIEELRGYKMTTPYKDIARLLNFTVGTICSRIFRLRERLAREFGESAAVAEEDRP